MTTANAGSLRSLREANRERVLTALGDGPLAQVQISARTGLSPASVTSLVRELLAEGRVSTSVGTASGRRATKVALVEAPTGLLSGVSLTRTGVVVALWDAQGTRVASRAWGELPLPEAATPRRVAAFITSLNPAGSALSAVTLCLPGWATEAVAPRPAFRSPPGHPLAHWITGESVAALESELGAPIVVKNDAKMAASAELAMGAARGVGNVLYAELSEGVGGALIIDGRVVEGDSGLAGEIGHVQGSEHGPRCWCGNRGCLELLVGAEALVPAIQAGHPEGDVSLETLIADAREEQDLALRILVEAGRDTGYALAPIAQVLDLSTLVVGGLLAQAGESFLSPLRETIASFSSIRRAALRVVPSELGRLGMIAGCLLESARRTGLHSHPEFNERILLDFDFMI